MLSRLSTTTMSLLKTLAAGLRALLRRTAFDRELDDELRDFVARTEEAHRRAGLSPAEATRAARVEIGSMAAVKDQVRAGLWEATVDTCLRDVRYGARQLWRRPGFALVAMLTMALGIGLNVTVFGALNAVVLRPLPIRTADRAVRLERWFESRSRGNGQYAFSYPEYVYLAVDLSPDVRVFAYTLALAAGAAVAFGLWPALEASRGDINSITKERSAQSTESARSRLRGLLIGAQVAVSTTLVITAGLLTRGVARSTSVNPGFDTAHVYLVSVPSDVQSALLARLAELPDVRAAAFAERVPLTGTWSPPVRIEDSTAPRGRAPQSTLLNVVSSGFFDTLGIPIVRGRNFTAEETVTGAPVAIISESGALAFWPEADPIGRQVKIDHRFSGTFTPFTVIGVVRDVRRANLSRVDPSFVYLATSGTQPHNLLVRSDRALPNLRGGITAALQTVSPGAVRTLSLQRFDQFVQVQRILPETVATFATVLAVMALALAAAGIHGVLSFLVSRRIREIGVRMAMGATPRHAVQLVVRQGLRPVAVGIGLGLIISSGLSAVLDALLIFPSSPDFLYGVSAFDPVTFVGLTVLVASMALVASAAPARRAAAVDPVIALLAE